MYSPKPLTKVSNEDFCSDSRLVCRPFLGGELERCLRGRSAKCKAPLCAQSLAWRKVAPVKAAGEMQAYSLPAMVNPSMRRVGQAVLERNWRSLPIAEMFINISWRLPATVISCTG